MSFKSAKNVQMYVAGYDISGESNKMGLSLPRTLRDVTTFQQTGHKWKPLLHKDRLKFDGFYDPTGELVMVLNLLRGSSGLIAAVLGIAQGDEAICGDGAFEDDYVLDAPIQGVLTLSSSFAFNGKAELDAVLLQPKATKTTDNNGLVYTTAPHKKNDTTNVITSPNATDQGSLNTLLNEIKADYNTHRVSTTFHKAADNTNVVDADDATDLNSSLTLANQIKAKYNAHRSQTGVHLNDDLLHEITSADANNLASAMVLANEIKVDYNGHLSTTASTEGGIGFLHVFSCGADDALIVKIQDDDDAAFPTPRDLVTFATANGRTSERKAVSGAIETIDRYVRVTWSGTAPYSAAFAVIWKRN